LRALSIEHCIVLSSATQEPIQFSHHLWVLGDIARLTGL
jgi:hypothetical protein